jgi:hypothetical protein
LIYKLNDCNFVIIDFKIAAKVLLFHQKHKQNAMKIQHIFILQSKVAILGKKTLKNVLSRFAQTINFAINCENSCVCAKNVVNLQSKKK